MDVCVLGCTPGHIPRYMGQTSNNNNRHRLLISVVFPIIVSVMCILYSCYGPLIIIVMHSCFDYDTICNSDSIRLDLCGMRQGYIYEGFLVWIIPSMY